MADVVDVLCRARELYASAPSHATELQFPEYGTYCVVTALSKAHRTGITPPDAYHSAFDAFVTVVGTGRLANWNAEHSTDEVLVAFDRAIEAQGHRVPAPTGEPALAEA
jgi:hypothetical protein